MTKYTATFQDGTKATRNSARSYSAAWRITFDQGKGPQTKVGFSFDHYQAAKAAAGVASRYPRSLTGKELAVSVEAE